MGKIVLMQENVDEGTLDNFIRALEEATGCTVNWDVAYFHKQNGGSKKIDGSYGGHLLDGKVHKNFPKRAGRP